MIRGEKEGGGGTRKILYVSVFHCDLCVVNEISKRETVNTFPSFSISTPCEGANPQNDNVIKRSHSQMLPQIASESLVALDYTHTQLFD